MIFDLVNIIVTVVLIAAWLENQQAAGFAFERLIGSCPI
jgi:hypothetical protein